MDFRFSDEQEQFRSTSGVSRAVSAPLYKQGDLSKVFPRPQLASMAHWLTGLRIPEELAGRCMPHQRYCGRGLPGAILTAGYFVEQNAFLGDLLRRFGSRGLQERYLPGMANGTEVMGIALTELAVGSDAANLTTRAVREGDAYILTGEKTSGAFAGAYGQLHIVFAKTDPAAGARGVSAMSYALPGTVSRRPAEYWLQIPGTRHREDHVRVPRDHLIGEEGRDFASSCRGLTMPVPLLR